MSGEIMKKEINVDSNIEEQEGKVIINLLESKNIELCIALSSKYGMKAGIKLNSHQIQQLVTSLEKSLEMLESNENSLERIGVDIVNIDSEYPHEEGIIVVSVYQDTVILCVSLTQGGDPELQLNKERCRDLIKTLADWHNS